MADSDLSLMWVLFKSLLIYLVEFYLLLQKSNRGVW